MEVCSPRTHHSITVAGPASLQELGTLLGVSAEKAESIAADMIMDGRLSGSIDQVRGSPPCHAPCCARCCPCVCPHTHKHARIAARPHSRTPLQLVHARAAEANLTEHPVAPWPQVEGLLRFDELESLLLWDAQIQSVCHKVNAIVDQVAAAGIRTLAS